MADQPISVAGASRPYPGETANGDAWTVQWHGPTCRIALIDGLGHGPAAAEAAQRATDLLVAQPTLAPSECIAACHQELRRTRGAVISIAALDHAARCLSYASVGNIGAQLWQSGRAQHLVADRGIVGAALPSIHTFSFVLEHPWLLMVYTDGIRTGVALESFPHLADPEPGDLAAAVLTGWGRATDDATVVVACPA